MMIQADNLAFALAHIRASGAATPKAALAPLERQARAAGRRLVTLPGGQAVLAWVEASEPSWPTDGSGPRRLPSTRTVLAFSACLRACWPDRDGEPYPGRSAQTESVVAAVAALSGTPVVASRRHTVGALTTLAAAGLVVLDDGGAVRLGPRVGEWDERQVAQLRDLWPRLPVPTAPSGR